MIIRLPFPPPGLFPNKKNGKHWSVTAALKVTQREAAFYLTKEAMGKATNPFPGADHIALSLLFLEPSDPKLKRVRDGDNMLAASKALIDGMATALGVDDKRFKPILIDWALGPATGEVVAAVGVEILSGMNLADSRGTKIEEVPHGAEMQGA